MGSGGGGGGGDVPGGIDGKVEERFGFAFGEREAVGEAGNQGEVLFARERLGIVGGEFVRAEIAGGVDGNDDGV